MKAASINEIKQDLKHISPTQVTELCLRLARYKKENKELLTYLLFEATDPETYIKSVKEEMDEAIATTHTTNLYFAKKKLRKLLRTTNKYIKYTASKVTEAELLLHFCKSLKSSNIPYYHSAALVNLYKAQLKKIKAAVVTFHEDLQYDYWRRLQELE